MAIISPQNSTPKDVDSLGTAISNSGLLKAAGNVVSGGPSPAMASALVKVHEAGTGTLANVASSATSVTILAASATDATTGRPTRKGVTIYNDSTQILYLKLAASAASATSYTIQMAAGTYYECPFSYTGEIRGIWASANGNARVTELT